MILTLQSAENAFKTVYLGVIANQLNSEINPLLAKIKHSNSDIWGKEVRKMTTYGINGGFMSGTENTPLPMAINHKYLQFSATLKNFYGSLEITDKALRASKSNTGAFVDLLNYEMEGLVKSCQFNLGRMLYGDGSGILCHVLSHEANTAVYTVDSTRNLIEGMCVNLFEIPSTYLRGSATRIKYIDRVNNVVTLDTTYATALTDESNYGLIVQASYNNDITGLGKLFQDSGVIYGLDRADYPFLKSYKKGEIGSISDMAIQQAIDAVEESTAGNIDMITCSAAVKRAYQAYLATYRRNIDVLELAGGYKAMSYNGIPVVSDRFVEEDTMYLLNTKDFTMHELCDWSWLEGDTGHVLNQKQGYSTYQATLVKYCELICDHPSGQAKLSGITIA